MKEAAGEANMTVITIVLIGIVAAIAIPLVRNVMTTAKKRSCCQSVGGVWDNGACSVKNSSEYNTCVNSNA